MERSKLLKLYAEKIIPGEKTLDDMLIWLQEQFEVDEMNLSEFTPSFLAMLHRSAELCFRNETKQLSRHELSFMAFKLKKDSRKNAEYYQRSYTDDHIPTTSIYVILEPNLKTFQCSSRLANLKGRLAWGISEKDVQEQSILFWEYLHNMWSLDHINDEQGSEAVF